MGLRRKAVYKKTIEFSRLMGRRRPKRLNSSQGLAWLRRLVTFSVYRFLKSFTTLQNTDGKRHTQVQNYLSSRPCLAAPDALLIHGPIVATDAAGAWKRSSGWVESNLARDGCCISRM
ncbi:hypothetical protein LMH87_004309 [Akanthomyces muscarius]|uniref:Uncharacterized protein n=1 Tax=Akanthomyces muscarius TaxID=2231603 RepID=A0A9W8Q3H9_AKAMU|nr:hypothetical protein LMH87_004309 [Akanthomyces muscarius]KAJ4145460.1 hypothetical protein LMH87_004309 [Akanthomyces muscarius]